MVFLLCGTFIYITHSRRKRQVLDAQFHARDLATEVRRVRGLVIDRAAVHARGEVGGEDHALTLLVFKGVYGVTIPHPTVEAEEDQDADRDFNDRAPTDRRRPVSFPQKPFTEAAVFRIDGGTHRSTEYPRPAMQR